MDKYLVMMLNNNKVNQISQDDLRSLIRTSKNEITYISKVGRGSMTLYTSDMAYPHMTAEPYIENYRALPNMYGPLSDFDVTVINEFHCVPE